MVSQLFYKKSYNYKSAGVDIDKADKIIKNINKKFNLDNLQNFAGLYSSEIFKGYKIFSCCDGIGSKIIPLIENNCPEIIANDLIAMNLNDLITFGAKPLFFLDYIAANNLKGDIIEKTIENINIISERFGFKLLGGEISELPSLISKNYFDIAGFLVGCCKNEDVLDKDDIKKGDVIIGFSSSGIHSNGFSLIRKLYYDKIMDERMFKECLKPTKIYADLVYNLQEKKLIKFASNITGGGIYSNLIRVIRNNNDIRLDYSSILKQEIFEFLKEKIDIDECYRVFNMGVGFCVFCSLDNVDRILEISKEYCPFILGEVV